MLSMANSESQGMVAGRTAYQIESAKRKAVGGKKKRCKKGKSCSATCIATNKVCLVDIPWVSAQGIPKAVSQIQKVSKSAQKPLAKGDKVSGLNPSLERFVKEEYKKKWTEAWKGMIAANNSGDRKTYDSHKKKISELHAKVIAKGVDVGPLKTPKWDGGGSKVVVVPSSVRPEPSVKPTKSSRKPAGLSDVEWDVIQKTEKNLKEEIRYSVKNGFFKKLYSDSRDRIISFNKKLKDEGVDYQVKVPPTANRMRQLSEAYDKREKTILDKLNDAISKGDKAAFDKGKLELQSLYSRLGKTLGKSDKTPETPWVTKIEPKDVVVAKGKMPLPQMDTNAQFKQTIKDTEFNVNTAAIDLHNRAKQILDVYNSSDPKAEAVRDEIIQKLGGRKAFDTAIQHIKEFTAAEYGDIREAQHKAMKGESLNSFDKERLTEANRVQALLSLMPKERVVKFRGIRVDEDTLNNIIESANLKGKFVDGGLASWSTALPVAIKFANNTTPEKNVRVVFRTVNKHGVGVEGISSIKREMEMLTPGTANYTHTGNYRVFKYAGDTYHVFDVIEN